MNWKELIIGTIASIIGATIAGLLVYGLTKDNTATTTIVIIVLVLPPILSRWR